MSKKYLLPLLSSAVIYAAILLPKFAPGNGLALTLLNYTIQNDSGNVNLGYTITINSRLYNDDTIPFTGQLDFGLRNSQQVLTNADHVFNRPPYSGTLVILNPGETVPAVFSVHVDDPYFLPGPDVVVVWPISSRPIADSILIPIHVIGPDAIPPPEEAAFGYLITPQKIMLQHLSPEIKVKQVRIYNVFGQRIVSFDSGIDDEIPLGYLPRGIYLCEIKTSNQKRKVIKFLH